MASQRPPWQTLYSCSPGGELLTFNDVDGGGCDYRGGESDDDCEGAEKEVGGHGTMGQQFKPVQQYRFRCSLYI